LIRSRRCVAPSPSSPSVFSLSALNARADEFTKADTDRYQKEYLNVVADGRALWTSGTLGTNGVACGQCHPNAANTHPETYPKFQKQLGKVAQLFEMVNWCVRNPLEGKPLAADDPKMDGDHLLCEPGAARRETGAGDALAPCRAWR